VSTEVTTYKVGEIRPSQLLFTFGIGSLIDLPHLSVIVMGLNMWNEKRCLPVREERLLNIVRAKLGPQVLHLLSPPLPEEESYVPFDKSNFIGVPVSIFPKWMLCPQCRSLIPLSSGLLSFKGNNWSIDKNKYIHNNCLKGKQLPEVLPARFLVACKKGHMADFPWVEFVHKGNTNCNGRLKFKEFGTSARGIDLYVECEDCGSIRNLVEAFTEPHEVLGKCNGHHPHLNIQEECDELLYCLVLGASNSWFPLLLSVLSVPVLKNELMDLVDKYWHSHFYDVETPKDIKHILKDNSLRDLLKYTVDEIWDVIQKRGENSQEKSEEDFSDIKGPEWYFLTNPSSLTSNKELQLKEVPPPDKFKKYFSKIVLVERLREVRSLIGFTRIEAPGDLSDSDEFNYDNMARIAISKPTWAPAVEIRGEGIFIQFNEELIQQWLKMTQVQKRNNEFFISHKIWRNIRKIENEEEGYPSVRYILLHTFAHTLMRRLTTECGYSSASIRERIYSLPEDDPRGPRAGVLIYTSTPDSEGTLGGLVSLGKPELLGRHIEEALKEAGVCSSDPICSEHLPSQDGKTLHGAACHACLFSPEPSCERGNKYLDRTLLVDTMNSECHNIAFLGL